MSDLKMLASTSSRAAPTPGPRRELLIRDYRAPSGGRTQIRLYFGSSSDSNARRGTVKRRRRGERERRTDGTLGHFRSRQSCLVIVVALPEQVSTADGVGAATDELGELVDRDLFLRAEDLLDGLDFCARSADTWEGRHAPGM